ncbi:MAG: SRPBCC family protein [Bdellovibrionia bacterium]
MSAKNKSNVIKITRIYDAPVKTVWEAWTDPEKVAKWWGPRGFTITHHSKDLRAGGHWSYTMHGPDGVDYPNTTKYLEVDKYARLVYDHGGHEDRPPLFRVTALFTDVKGKTKLEMSMALATPEAAEETRKFIKKAGGEGTWDRLAEFLEEESKGKDIFIYNRSFDAPIETMWKMWTDPKHVMNWMAPTGLTGEYIRADIRPGGEAVYFMTDGKSLKMYGRANYLELKKPERLIYTQQFIDKDENIARHPHAPTWPETMKTTVTLTEEGPDCTRVTIQWEVHGEATKAEREMFHSAKAGMSQGWGGSLDKLEEYITKN